VKEILRVLRPGGWAILQVPFFPPVPEFTLEDPSIQSSKDRFENYGQEDHLRLYGHDYRQRLESCGFAVIEDKFIESLPPEQVKRYALINEVIYFCTKPIV
jgi:hypothetical protein